MFKTDTLDTIAEGSTLRRHGALKVRGAVATQTVPRKKDSRSYGDASGESLITGAKDTKNKRLTVKLQSVHTIRHSDEQNRVEGAWRMNVIKKSPMKRKRQSINTPAGCNGPVICKVGIAMRNIITQHDPKAPVHAATHEQFSHGGVAFKKPVVKASMIGAGGALPTTGPEAKSLQNAVGLHYTTNVKPGKVLTPPPPAAGGGGMLPR